MYVKNVPFPGGAPATAAAGLVTFTAVAAIGAEGATATATAPLFATIFTSPVIDLMIPTTSLLVIPSTRFPFTMTTSSPACRAIE